MEQEKKVVNVKEEHNIHIGNNNKISKSSIGNSNETKEGVGDKFIWKLVVPVIVGVLIALIRSIFLGE